MPRSRVVEVGGSRFTVRGLTFEELVMLGSVNAENKESKEIVAEVLSQCLVRPKLERNQISELDEKTLVSLVSGALTQARGNLENMDFVTMPQDKGPPRDMIA